MTRRQLRIPQRPACHRARRTAPHRRLGHALCMQFMTAAFRPACGSARALVPESVHPHLGREVAQLPLDATRDSCGSRHAHPQSGSSGAVPHHAVHKIHTTRHQCNATGNLPNASSRDAELGEGPQYLTGAQSRDGGSRAHMRTACWTGSGHPASGRHPRRRRCWSACPLLPEQKPAAGNREAGQRPIRPRHSDAKGSWHP